ncbi:hypothetical protein [Rhodoferax sp.]|uniref:hypothetical protein n=1 Tax=Rhodoferax sp. TaxID=50421 RepID=UPI00374CC4FA
MHLDTRIHWPRYALALVPPASTQRSWFDHCCQRYSEWVNTWLQRHSAPRREPQPDPALADLSPHLLNDIGCPVHLHAEVKALRRELRLGSFEAHIH